MKAISPYQTKAMPNMVRNYVFNFYRRVSAEAIYFLVPFGIGELYLSLSTFSMFLRPNDVCAGYGIYTWGKARYEYVNSKAGHLAAGGHH